MHSCHMAIATMKLIDSSSQHLSWLVSLVQLVAFVWICDLEFSSVCIWLFQVAVREKKGQSECHPDNSHELVKQLQKMQPIS